MLAVGMAVLTVALDGSKGTGISGITLAALVICGVLAIALYLKHAHRNPRALFSLNLFHTPTFSLGLLGSFAGRIGSGMLPFMTPVFYRLASVFTFSCRADDGPDGARQYEHEAHCGTGR